MGLPPALTPALLSRPPRVLASPAVRALGAELAQVIGHMHELAVFAKWEWLPTQPHTISDKHILAAQHACRKLLNGEPMLASQGFAVLTHPRSGGTAPLTSANLADLLGMQLPTPVSLQRSTRSCLPPLSSCLQCCSPLPTSLTRRMCRTASC